MVMRVGGLATGMDIDQIVNRLMDAERIPLRKLEQDRTLLTWKQEAFRDLNLALSEFERMMLDMKMSRTYETKKIRSTQENAVTATGGSQASEGTYNIQVEQLATTAMNVGGRGVDIEQVVELEGPIIFYTFDETGNKKTHEIEVEEGDTVGKILQKITNGDSPVRAFIDGSGENSRVILETTRTGQYNTTDEFGGAEIGFEEDSFFTDILKLTVGKADPNDPNSTGETGGQNAKFTYNHGLTLETRDNSYTINNINFQFHDTTDGHASLSVTNDVDHAFDKIMAFVDKYNAVIEKLNDSQQERRYRDYLPLTQEQRDEMSEKEIERWEEQAKSGLLRGERVIVDGMTNMRRSWYESSNADGVYQSITQIGITTSKDYLDGGKLIIDEEKLKEALRDNPSDVRKLFADSKNGVVGKLEKSVKQTIDRIHDHAGRATSTLDNYALGKRMKDIDEQIDAFQRRLIQVENRYWNQFTQMEKAIQRMNEQSSYMFAQFYGDM